MSLEDLTGVDKGLEQLVITNPTSLDQRAEGDDHIRGVKNALLNTFGVMQSRSASLPADGAVLQWDQAAGRYKPVVLASVLPLLVGVIMYRHSVGTGMVRANGQQLLKATYPELWTYAQGFLTADQAVNPGLYKDVDAANFLVPKLDGLFIRGSGQVDASHVSLALGVKQADVIKPAPYGSQSGGFMVNPGGTAFFGSGGSTMEALSQGSAGCGPETRPVNVALLPCIFTGR